MPIKKREFQVASPLRTVLREQRAAIQGMHNDLGLDEAFDLWLEVQECDSEKKSQLRSLHSHYTKELA